MSATRATSLCFRSYCHCYRQSPHTLAPFWIYYVTQNIYGPPTVLEVYLRHIQSSEQARTTGEVLFGSK